MNCNSEFITRVRGWPHTSSYALNQVGWAAVEMLRNGIAHEPEGQKVKARWPLGSAVPGTLIPVSTKSAHGKRKSVSNE